MIARPLPVRSVDHIDGEGNPLKRRVETTSSAYASQKVCLTEKKQQYT